MSGDIIWEEPPAKSRRSGATQRFVDELKASPGTWGRMPATYSAYAMTTINRSKYPDCEWVTRKLPNGRFGIWARYIGGDES